MTGRGLEKTGLARLAGSMRQGEVRRGERSRLGWKGNFPTGSSDVVGLGCHGLCEQAGLCHPSSISRLKEPN